VSELKENEYEINAHNNVSLKPYQGAGEENSTASKAVHPAHIFLL
jgi:hypothetical protein